MVSGGTVPGAGPGTIKGKILLLGDGAVGKSSLIQRFVLDQFSDDYVSTIGAKITKKSVIISSGGATVANVTMMIWDIPGQWEHTTDRLFSFRKYRPQSQFFLGARGALIVCDIADKGSLLNMELWVDALHQEVGDIPKVFCVNKADLTNQYGFSFEDAVKLAERFKSPAILTSAKTGSNVNLAFSNLAQQLYIGQSKK